MMHGMYGSIWMMIFWLAFWVILIGISFYLLTRFVNRSNKKAKDINYKSNNEKTSLQTLQERLVKGEIDEAEYERYKLIIER